MTLERISDHLQQALDDRAGPFQTLDVEKLMTPLGRMVQALEDAFHAIYLARVVSSATGDALEILGAMSGEYASDDGEEGLRQRIMLKLAARYANKLRAGFVNLLSLLPGVVFALGEGPGIVTVVQVSGVLAVKGPKLLELLQIASADGVIVRLLAFESGSEGPVMGWPSADGTIDGTPWPSADGSELGGVWPGVRHSETT